MRDDAGRIVDILEAINRIERVAIRGKDIFFEAENGAGMGDPSPGNNR